MDIEAIKDRLGYDPAIGQLRWIKPRKGVRVGAKAGSIGSEGYIVLHMEGRVYKGHRVAWLLHYGKSPEGIVDHINGDRADNRIANLRIVTPAQSRMNSGARSDTKSGVKGVYWSATAGRWIAQIRGNGIRRFVGQFAELEDAKRAYAIAAKEVHGEYARAQ